MWVLWDSGSIQHERMVYFLNGSIRFLTILKKCISANDIYRIRKVVFCLVAE